MPMQVERTEDEIYELGTWAEDRAMHGVTDHAAGTYEEGVLDTLRWMMGETDNRPDQVDDRELRLG